MEIKFIKQDKNEIEISVDNLTIAEVLRSYLNKQGVEFVAWRKEHPTKPIVLRIQVSSGTIKKVVSDAVSAVNKDMDKLVKSVK